MFTGEDRFCAREKEVGRGLAGIYSFLFVQHEGSVRFIIK